jgi:hypothetical protein
MSNRVPAWDPGAPSSARLSDCLLGGYNYNPADKDLAAELERICPEIRAIALSGREFLARAVTWAARQGIAQFIDLGCGAPVAAEYQSVENLLSPRADADIHTSARAVNPRAAVAYVDCDRLGAREARLVLEPAGPGIVVVEADLRDPWEGPGGSSRSAGHQPRAAGVRDPGPGRALHDRRSGAGGRRRLCPAYRTGELRGDQHWPL